MNIAGATPTPDNPAYRRTTSTHQDEEEHCGQWNGGPHRSHPPPRRGSPVGMQEGSTTTGVSTGLFVPAMPEESEMPPADWSRRKRPVQIGWDTESPRSFHLR